MVADNNAVKANPLSCWGAPFATEDLRVTFWHDSLVERRRRNTPRYFDPYFLPPVIPLPSVTVIVWPTATLLS
jgi:hypothetical protein